MEVDWVGATNMSNGAQWSPTFARRVAMVSGRCRQGSAKALRDHGAFSGRLVSALDRRDRRTRLDGSALGDRQLDDRAGLVGCDLVLHLHRLYDA